MSICCPRLRNALVYKKSFKSLLCLSGQTALVNVKVIEFKSNQSRRSLAFTDAERATKRQINKREVRCLVNCFTKEMLNDRQLYSVKQTTRLVSQIFKSDREREEMCMF